MRWKTEPWPHQFISWKRGIEQLSTRGRFALLSETGTGKSKVILDLVAYYKESNPTFQTLIVCPKSVLREWPTQIQEHSNLSYIVLEGSWMERGAKLELNRDVYLLNYHGLKVIPQVFLDHTWDLVVLDESQWIKDFDSDITKVGLLLGAKAHRRIISTGTPVTQSLEEAWSQWLFLDRGATFGRSLPVFRSRYMKNVGRSFPKWVPRRGAKTKVWSRMVGSGVWYPKDRVLGLPPQTFSWRHCELEGDQLSTYLYFLNREDLPPVVMLNKLAQVTGGFVYEDEEGERNPRYCETNVKLKVLQELLGEIGPHHNVIILCRYVAEANLLKSILASKSLPLEEWQNSVSPAYLIGTGGSLSVGLNLQKAHYLIYFSSSYSVHDRIQSEGRIWRGGQTRTCHYIDLIADGTTDEHIHRILAEGRFWNI